MGKIIATYSIKLTIREPDAAPAGDERYDAPTNDAVADAVGKAIAELTGVDANATSERTDK